MKCPNHKIKIDEETNTCWVCFDEASEPIRRSIQAKIHMMDRE